ncbi:MAG: hypothetical protein SWX82_14390 [Cyanobacteriota bacterium]|nr:hypothetical protein [Cyanobacteriota bacterium]
MSNSNNCLPRAIAHQHSNNYCPIVIIAKEGDITAEWMLRKLLSCNKAISHNKNFLLLRENIFSVCHGLQTNFLLFPTPYSPTPLLPHSLLPTP